MTIKNLCLEMAFPVVTCHLRCQATLVWIQGGCTTQVLLYFKKVALQCSLTDGGSHTSEKQLVGQVITMLLYNTVQDFGSRDCVPARLDCTNSGTIVCLFVCVCVCACVCIKLRLQYHVALQQLILRTFDKLYMVQVLSVLLIFR